MEINNFLNLLNHNYYSNFIQQNVRYFTTFLSYPNQKRIPFNNHKYKVEVIKPFNDDIITQFFMLSLNKIIEDEKKVTCNKVKNNDILFISIILSKLYNEKIISENVVLKISTSLLENQKYQSFFEILGSTGIGQLINNIQEKNLKANEKIALRQILTENPQYLKDILSLDYKAYKPYIFISSLFQFKFNLNLVSADLLLNDFSYNGKNYLTKNYFINVFRLLIDLFEKEEKIEKRDIIRGMYTIDGFTYSNKIQLVEKFTINLNFKIYQRQKENLNEFIIFRIYKDANNDLIKLYIDDKYNLKFRYHSNEFIILDGKNMDFNHIHSMKMYFMKEIGWVGGFTEKIKILLNGQEYSKDYSNLSVDGEELSVSFGQFNGELIEFSIMNNKKEIFKINFLGLINLYKDNLIQKEYILDQQNSKFIKIDKDYRSTLTKPLQKRRKTFTDLSKGILNFTDYLFENKKTILKFLDEYGLEYIASLLLQLTKEILNSEQNNVIDIKDIYEILNEFWELFKYLYKILIERVNEKDKKNSNFANNNKYYFKKLMTVLYSYSILQSSLSEKMSIPENLVNKINEFLKDLSDDNSSIVAKSFLNHILMIVLTQKNPAQNNERNTNNIPIGKLANFLKSLIASKELNYYLDCYISILIDLFSTQREMKEIKDILLLFIDNFSEAHLIKYIIIFQQFALNQKNNYSDAQKQIEEKNRNYQLSYELLIMVFNSKICEKTNIIDKSDTDIILYNFQKIFQLTNDIENEKQKENENEENCNPEKSHSSDDEEESEEDNQNYLSKLKAISIRIIDHFIIKKYRVMGRKSMLVKDERYSRVKNSIAILFSMTNLDLYIIRSFLLTSFDTPNEHGLRFIEHGLDNDGINISELKLIESFTSIKFMFSIFDILKNKSHKNYYFKFIKLFINETTKKIRLFADSKESNTISYKKNYSMNIFEYKKIGILLNNIIIELKRMPDNTELDFNSNYLITVIQNTLFLHPNLFFFSLILDLIRDYIKDGNAYEYEYIIKMVENIVNLLNYEKISKEEKFKTNIYLEKNYQINCVKLISLIYEITHLYVDEDEEKPKVIENDTIYENEKDQQDVLKFIFNSFLTFIQNNINNPLLYSLVIVNKENNLIILEVILDVFYWFSHLYISEEKKITNILNTLIYPKIIEEFKKKNIVTVLCYIDVYKDNKSNENKSDVLIPKICDLEQKLLKTRELNIINYFFTLKILRIIISNICKYNMLIQKQKIKKDIDAIKSDEDSYYNFLNVLKNNLVKELNIFYLKDITKKYRIKTLDNDYNKFRVKIENCLLRKEKLEDILDKYIEDNNEVMTESDNDSLSLYSSKNLETEGDDKSVLSGNSSISIKPTEAFKFKNTDIFQEKNIKYDAVYKKKNINNIKFWQKEIGLEGLFLIFKSSRIIDRGIFSAFVNKDDLYDESFINKIIPEFHNYTHYKLSSEMNNNILYPTQLKNYITTIYTKPFLKRYKNIYTDSSFSSTHKYFIHLQNSNELKIKNNKIPFVFDEMKEIKCELITNKGSIYCNLYLKEDFIIIKNCDVKIENPKDYHLFSSNQYVELYKLIIIPYSDIKQIFTRRFLYMYQACEIFTVDNKSYLINFFERTVLLEKFYNDIKKIYPNVLNKIIENVREFFEFRHFIDDWNSNKIDNFTLLNMLNKYSSRSYNDLQQYPVFPWLFTRYSSELLQYKKYNLLSSLKNTFISKQVINSLNKTLYEKFLRAFQFPISAQTDEKRKEIQKTYDKSFLKFKSHFNSHYSTSAIIYYFLVRISPITEEHVKFQGGQFDKIERMFFGPDNFLKIIDYLKDSRELIPDMFYLYEMYFNMNYNYFGYSNTKQLILNNVIYPSENMTPIEFVYFNRAKLNSNLISDTLNLWINNIFGVNQLEGGDPDKMRNSCNIYPWQCYEKIFRKYYEQFKVNKEHVHRRKQSVFSPRKINNTFTTIFERNEDDIPIDSSNIREQLNTINLFGQCPVEILKKYLGKKDRNMNKFNLLSSKEDNDGENNNQANNKTIKEKEIIYISYNNSHKYIIYINNKKILYIINKEDFSEKYKFSIIGNFVPLTSSIVINFNNCETLIISNIMDEKIILAEKGKLKYQHKICDIPTCLCKIDSNNFYVGTINGYIQKIKITFQPNQEDFKEIENIADEKKVLGHRYKLVRDIIYNPLLNILISLGDDNRIFIRNEAFFEVLTVIDLSLFINQNLLNYKNNSINLCKDFIFGNRILLNNYDTLYYLNSYSGCIIAFTLNGLKISKTNLINIDNNKNKNVLSSYLINIYDDFRFFFCDQNKNKLVEYNPANLEEIFFEYNLELNNVITDDENEIKALFYNEVNKCFDIWIKKENNIEIARYNLVEQFDKIDIKPSLIRKESKDMNNKKDIANSININNNLALNEKRLKMEKFAKKKGQFKTTVSFTTRNFENKNIFP